MFIIHLSPEQNPANISNKRTVFLNGASLLQKLFKHTWMLVWWWSSPQLSAWTLVQKIAVIVLVNPPLLPCMYSTSEIRRCTDQECPPLLWFFSSNLNISSLEDSCGELAYLRSHTCLQTCLVAILETSRKTQENWSATEAHTSANIVNTAYGQEKMSMYLWNQHLLLVDKVSHMPATKFWNICMKQRLLASYDLY